MPASPSARYSCVTGDQIEVQPSGGDPTGKCFQGFVHEVRLSDVGVAFHISFKPAPNARFNVRFKLNRVPLRRQHEALGVPLASPARILFPEPTHVGARAVSAGPTEPPIWYNPLVAQNAPQVQAVIRILQRSAGLAPFIIFGP